MKQASLFAAEAATPEGFRYMPDAVSADEEAKLHTIFKDLPFEPFQFHQYQGLRRIVSFGFRYDYGARRVRRSDPLPPSLLNLRNKAGELAGCAVEDLSQALVTEYAKGAGIGWHRDKSEFEKVVAFSFAGPALLRFRRKDGERWERRTVRVEPRSAYVLEGAARSEWQHSIPAVEELRYSVTFRNFVRGISQRGGPDITRE
jgi:alkylated DNA repair dioxygenase AlkB